MTDERTAQRPRQGNGGGGGSPPQLPDINAETYPFEVVQRLLDRAAVFNMFVRPEAKGRNAAIHEPGQAGRVIGIGSGASVHRLRIDMHTPSLKTGVKVANSVAEACGRLAYHLLVIPDEFVARPDREPPPTILDPSRTQRFVVQDLRITFANLDDGFRGFGTGQTFPVAGGHRSQIPAAAVVNITDGTGRFAGLEGTLVLCGEIAPDHGYYGNILCRVIDPEGRLYSGSIPPRRDPESGPEPGATYMIFRGQKKDRSEKSSYSFGPDGRVTGFRLEQELRSIDLDFSAHGQEGTRAVAKVGPVIGSMKSQVFLNIMNPGAPGTGTAPVPFRSYNEYVFTDPNGAAVGGFAAEGGEGRSFNEVLAGAPGQQALRFGAFQTLTNGTGRLSGAQGFLTDNSIVGVAPHATSTLYLLRISDPDGRYRAALQHAPR